MRKRARQPTISTVDPSVWKPWWSAATMPTLAIDGGKSPLYMRNGMKALAAMLPRATHLTLPGQTHMVKAKVVVPVLEEFFNRAGA